MPLNVTAYQAPDTGPTTQPATANVETSWIERALNAFTDGPATTITIALIAALIAAATTWALMRRPGTVDISKRLMYAPLLLVNGAAVYGQVAFFYEEVAPQTWLTLGKVILAVVIALAIESVSIYVGWHAHDALLKKATNTAARLRRWSYLIAGGVAAINYAHFAEGDAPLGINAAAVAFGMLSLLSPWLWGLHTRREQRVQLLREGRVDEAGATFSGERIRSFPIRSYLARRWSIDHYVTDPKQAWEGYNADLRARWAVTSTDEPGWWLRINPASRVRQLTAALSEAQVINGRQQTEIGDIRANLTEALGALAAAHGELTDTTSQLEAAVAHRAASEDSLRAITDRANTEIQDVIARHAQEKADLIAEHRQALTAQHQNLTAEKDAAVAKVTKDLTDEFTAELAALKLTNLTKWREDQAKGTSPKGSGKTSSRPSSAAASKQLMSDKEAVQAMLSVHSDPGHEWSEYAVRKTTGAGYGNRIPRLIEMWRRAAIEKASGDTRGEGPAGDIGEPMAAAQ